MNKLISFLFPVFLFGQFDQVANGFGLDIGSSGSGMFVTRHYGHTSEKFALNGELKLKGKLMPKSLANPTAISL